MIVPKFSAPVGSVDVVSLEGQWSALIPDTSGKVLTCQGIDELPIWQTPAVPNLSDVVVLDPGTSTRNLVKATADVPDLTLRPFSNAQTSPTLRIQDAAGAGDLFSVDAKGNVGVFDSNGTQTLSAGVTGGLTLAPSSDIPIALTIIPWSNNGGDSLLIRDSSFNPVFRLTADGLLAFFNVTPVIQQVNASAVGIALVTDPNVKAALTAIRALLIAFGLGAATA